MTGAAPDIIELIDRPFFSTGKSAAEKLTTCQNGANDACNDLDQEPVDRACLLETIALHGQVQVAIMLDRVAIGIE